MKKALIGGAVAVALLVVAAAWLAYARLGDIVKTAVETYGPRATGAAVTLERVLLSPLSGTARMKGLFVGNPAGFKSGSAIRVKDARVELDLKSLRSDFVRVREIVIDGPEVTFEMGAKGSNLTRLQKNAESFVLPSPIAAKGVKAKPAAGAKPLRLVIGLFKVTNGKVRLAVAGQDLAVPLPDIELRGIGEQTDGATVAEAVSAMLRAVASAALKAAGGAGGLVQQGAKALESLGKSVAKDGAKTLEGLFKKKR